MKAFNVKAYNVMLDVDQVSEAHFYLLPESLLLEKGTFLSNWASEFEYNYAILHTVLVSDNVLFISKSENLF